MRPFILRTPLGAFGWDPGDKGTARIVGRSMFATRLFALHRDAKGQLVEQRTHGARPFELTPAGYDIGSGLVTNVGAYALANDFAWSASLNLSTLGLANNHAWGTGATADAAPDFQIQTLAAPTTTTAVAGVQTLTNTAAVPKLQSVATITAGGTLTISEWGIHSFITLTASTGSPFTATSATSGTSTGTSLTASSASVRGSQQMIVENATSAVWGLVLSNSTSVFTLASAGGVGWWTNAASTAGSTPGNTAYVILPVMFDHRHFTGIGVNLNDTIAFTWLLTVTSGG